MSQTHVRPTARPGLVRGREPRRAVEIVLLLATVSLLILVGWSSVLYQNRTLTQTTIAAYQQTELEIVRTAARGIMSHWDQHTDRLGDDDAAEFETILRQLIAPVQLLESGDAWVYAPDGIALSLAPDLSSAYHGKTVAQIFALQAEHGASHYQDMVDAVMNGREGVGWYVWHPDRGQEIAAWTPIQVHGETWVIGLSTPLSEVLDSTGAHGQMSALTAAMSGATAVTLILMVAWCYNMVQRERAARALRRAYDELEIRVADRTAELRTANAGLQREIGERMRAEAALRESESRLRRVTDNMLDLITELDLEGRIRYASPSHHTVLGYEPERMLAQAAEDFVHPDDRLYLRDSIASAMTTRTPIILNYRCQHADGRYLWLESVGNPLADGDGQTASLVFGTRDITDRKRLEEQLRHAQKMEALGQLAGGVARDFNNLLTVINGYSQCVLATLGAKSPHHDDVRAILDAGERAAHLTRQLLAFSRRQALEMRVLCPNELLLGMGGGLRRTAGQDVSLAMRLSKNLGNVRVDPAQIEQAVMNLAMNAREAMSEGGALTLETTNVDLDEAYAATHVDATSGPHVCLVVRDTGCGIAPEIMDRLFEPFFTTKPLGEGLGLGLSTVYGIVRQSGGSIDVESEVGQGTCVRIYLPRVYEKAERLTKQREAPALSRGAETILLIEDQHAVRTLTARLLRELGYQVLEAARGADAISIFQDCAESVQLVLTDVSMPAMSGPEVVQRLREIYQGFAVVFMSGYADLGADDHDFAELQGNLIQKPFSLSKLASTVRGVLDKQLP